MYRVADYGALIADTVRMGAFVTALKRTIKPGAIVIDVGTGTGIFALIACALGARRVYAIEPNDAIDVAREIAAANGYADRIEFHHARSTDVTLPERGEVLIADIGGMLPWFERAIPSIVDARRRLLAPDGVILPRRDTIWTAVVDAAEMYSRLTRGWEANEFGIDMSAARDLVVNAWARGRISEDQLLAPPRRCAGVDYANIDDPDVEMNVEWVIARAGVGHGVAAGFDRTVVEGVEISNAPDAPAHVRPTLVYEPVFFPWPRPLVLEAGDVVSLELKASLLHDEYVWAWKTQARRGNGETKGVFNQSTFLGTPLSLERFRRQARQ